MNGRAAVATLQSRLDATFGRAGGLGDDAELLSDFARHLCVLVSGFLEEAVRELLMEHVRRQSSPTVQRFVESRLSRFTNAKSQRLVELLNSFDQTWGSELEAFLADEYKDAVNSLISLRHRIAHGHFVGITLSRVSDYYSRVKRVVDCVADLALPAG